MTSLFTKRSFGGAVCVACCVAWGCAGLAGCGENQPETVPVSGVVRLNGEPVGPGKIAFYPETGRAALGTIDEQGRYALTTFTPGDGVLPGTHRVTITVTSESGPPPAKSFEEEMRRGASATTSDSAQEVRWVVPQIYSQKETTPLSVDLPLGGRDPLDFELTVQ